MEKAELEAQRALNMIDYQDEIKSRPKKRWFKNDSDPEK